MQERKFVLDWIRIGIWYRNCKEGLPKLYRKLHNSYAGDKKRQSCHQHFCRQRWLETRFKLNYDMQTFTSWIDVRILNLTHAFDGNEIVLIKTTPFNYSAEYPRLPTAILYSMATQKLKLGDQAYCACVKQSLTSKGLAFLNLFLCMILCLLPLIAQKFVKFSGLVENSVARGRLSLKLFLINHFSFQFF